jgi:transposase
MKSIAYVGLDVHKDCIVGAIMPMQGEIPIAERKFANDRVVVKKWITRWSRMYDLRCCYEASSCGYVLARWLKDIGVQCDVIAPSLIPSKPGEKISTDRRSALKLARLYRAGELTKVYIPDEDDESVRSLVRCRETLVREVVKSRHYVLKFLTVRGLAYKAGKNWTQAHWRYLWGLEFEGADAIVFGQYLALLEYKLAQVRELNRQIEAVASSEKYRESVGRLRCLRGVDTQTAMVIVAEVLDFRRFSGPRELMAYIGLVPGEKSSGETRKQGGITKTGNSRARRVLVEAAWHYQHKPALGEALKKRQQGQPLDVIAHAWKAQHRLYKKFWGIAIRKERCKAATAVARELVGFIWALMTKYSSAQTQAAT